MSSAGKHITINRHLFCGNHQNPHPEFGEQFLGGNAMKLRRRQFLHLVAGVVALPAVSLSAWAQAYPSRPVRILVGFAAGNAADIMMRLIGQWLTERLGQPFVVENRGGAGGRLATEAVARAAPDGYSLGFCGSNDAINATLYDKLNFNFTRDIAPVASIASGPLVLVVNPSFPAKTVPEFIAYAKANPGKVNFASAGTGTVAQMAGELFKVMAGVDLTHVPYRGLGPALIDLLGGQVQAIFSTMPPAIQHIRSDKLRALAVTSATRYEALPNLPTIGDFLPAYEAALTLGLGAPKNTPAEIIDKLNKETNAALADPGIKAKLANLGVVPSPKTPAEFGKQLADETEKWGKVIKSAGIKPQ
jgi:tripartite-type tricarboxylate transporter receptor subunit TctC